MNGDRQRALAYHDLERLDDDQALLLHGDLVQNGSRPRDDARPSHRITQPLRRGWTPELRQSPWLTDREREERWPIG